jgi:hypothetical protein
VTTWQAIAATGRRRLSRRHLRRAHPGWWVNVAAAGAWIALLTLHITDSSPVVGPPPMPDMPAHPGHHNPHENPAMWTGQWALMVIAMMWPLYASVAAAIAGASFRRWQAISVTTFITVTSALWIGCGWAVRCVFLLLKPSPVLWAVAWLAVGIAATRSLWRTRALQRCVRLSVIAPSGGRAIITSARNAARVWPRCALLCGPVMVAMVDVHQLPAMVGGSVAVWWEQWHPRAFRDWVPVAALTATAVFLMIPALSA